MLQKISSPRQIARLLKFSDVEQDAFQNFCWILAGEVLVSTCTGKILSLSSRHCGPFMCERCVTHHFYDQTLHEIAPRRASTKVLKEQKRSNDRQAIGCRCTSNNTGSANNISPQLWTSRRGMIFAEVINKSAALLSPLQPTTVTMDSMSSIDRLPSCSGRLVDVKT